MTNIKIILLVLFVSCSSPMKVVKNGQLDMKNVIDGDFHYFGFTPALGDSVFTWNILEAIDAGIVIDSALSNGLSFTLFGRAYCFDSTFSASQADVIFGVLIENPTSLKSKAFTLKKVVKCDKGGKFTIKADIIANSFLAVRNKHTYVPAIGMYSYLYRVDKLFNH